MRLCTRHEYCQRSQHHQHEHDQPLAHPSFLLSGDTRRRRHFSTSGWTTAGVAATSSGAFSSAAGAPAPAEEKCVGSQMEASLQSLPELLRRLCSQMEAAPQSLHWFLIRLCSQMEAPLHELLRRLCSQMEVPPQSLHRSLRFLCSQMLLPPQSTH